MNKSNRRIKFHGMPHWVYQFKSKNNTTHTQRSDIRIVIFLLKHFIVAEILPVTASLLLVVNINGVFFFMLCNSVCYIYYI